MTEHTLFYYPYASFSNKQLPLLKTAALYFDKLFILDPVAASSGAQDDDWLMRDAAEALRAEEILKTVRPADVLAKYSDGITAAIRRDMTDREFLNLCDAKGGTWKLSLSKVPEDMQADQAMRHLMGDFAREVSATAQRSSDRTGEYKEFVEHRDERAGYREGYKKDVEYRFAEFPLALGESIMMNHALFAGLLHSQATPITDDPFHSSVLAHKLVRAGQEPALRDFMEDRTTQRQMKANELASKVLGDGLLKLPILNPEMPLTEILEYRLHAKDTLGALRDKLGWMARRIVSEPWTKAFADELEHKTIPDLAGELESARRSRDEWVRDKRRARILKASGIALTVATVALTVYAAPVTPIAIAIAGLGLAKDVALPTGEWWSNWKKGEKAAQENGLHYLLRI